MTGNNGEKTQSINNGVIIGAFANVFSDDPRVGFDGVSFHKVLEC